MSNVPTPPGDEDTPVTPIDVLRDIHMNEWGIGGTDSPAVQRNFKQAMDLIARRLNSGSSGNELALDVLGKKGLLVSATTGDPVQIHDKIHPARESVGGRHSSHPIAPTLAEDALVEECRMRIKENIEEVRRGVKSYKYRFEGEGMPQRFDDPDPVQGQYHTYLKAEFLLMRLQDPSQAHTGTYMYTQRGLGEQRCQDLFRETCDEMGFTIIEAKKIMNENRAGYQQELVRSRASRELHKKQ